MKNLLLILFVAWEFEAGNAWFSYRDVLEFKDAITGVWRDVPGPYTVVNGNNVVEVGGTSAQFYRVRRSYGTPNI